MQRSLHYSPFHRPELAGGIHSPLPIARAGGGGPTPALAGADLLANPTYIRIAAGQTADGVGDGEKQITACQRQTRVRGENAGRPQLTSVEDKVKNLLLIAAATAPLIAVNASANTSVLDTELLTNCATVATSGSDAGEAVKPVADCVATRWIDDALDTALALTNAGGKARFGTGFSVQNSLHYSLFNRSELSGDIDLVLPLRSVAGDQRDADGNLNTAHAFFMQNGVTRWTDAHGDVRHDLRFGLVHRRVTPGDNLLGASLLLQQNRERGHERLAAGLDYVGSWGSGALTWYAPQSDWRRGRLGFEERALSGVELDLRLQPTTAVGVNFAAGRWQNRNGVGADELRTRLGLQWRPHPYLRFSGEADDLGGRDSSHQVVASVEVPLGGGERAKPRWRGFGVASSGEVNNADVWRGVQPRRLEVAERKAASAGVSAGDVSVRFMQASAPSGSAIGLQARIDSPRADDIRVTVQLTAGSGDNPAVADVDFPATPIVLVIPAGQTSGDETVQLPNNAGMTAGRSLAFHILSTATGV